MPFQRFLGGAALAPLLLCWGAALAASLDVNPVRIDFAPGARSAELRLTNTGSEEISVQVDVREWLQTNGREELVETRALLAVPPLVTIPPGQRQVVRIGHLGEPPREVERSFRVLVTELAPAADKRQPPGLRVRLRLSIPVFVEPVLGPAAPRLLIGDVAPMGEGTRIDLHNAGSAHARIERVELRFGNDWIEAPGPTVSRVRYVLPSARAQLDIPPGSASLAAIRIRAAGGWEWEHAVQVQ